MSIDPDVPAEEAARRDRTAAERLGAALTALRRERGLSQAEVGARIGMTSQGWGLYEAGRRAGLFRPDVQRRLTGALDATPEALALKQMEIGDDVPETPTDAPGGGMKSGGVRSGGATWREAAAKTTANVETLQLTNDELAPWAGSGVVLEFDFGRWPRGGQGCVIDLRGGERWVRLYDRADAERLYLRGGPGGLAWETVLERTQVTRLAAVTARRE